MKMEQSSIHEAVRRVARMERCFDALRKAEEENPSAAREDAGLKELLQILTRYYESGQWMSDYELDERGLLPKELKRGVLSQDAVYDLLVRIRRGDGGGFAAARE